MQEGLEMLRQIAAMLTSLAKAVSKDTYTSTSSQHLVEYP